MSMLVGASTKMNLTSTEAVRYLARLRDAVGTLKGVSLFVLPPFTSIWVAREQLSGSNIAWGAQDVHPEEQGAHTGDVSAAMLEDLGCSYVECGHSERRRSYGESDVLIARKVLQIVRHGMTPVVCVGESEPTDTLGTVASITAQVTAALELLSRSEIELIVVAYEPVWAIGVGATPADPGHISVVHRAIHELLEARAGRTGAGRVIYGGSVDPQNSRLILDVPAVDGVFIGRSALDPSSFAAIAGEAALLTGSARSSPTAS